MPPKPTDPPAFDAVPISAPPAPAVPVDPSVIVTVLVAKTIIKGLARGKGVKLRMPLSQANVLASLNPPRVSIDGV